MLLGVDHRRQHQLLRAGALGEVEQARREPSRARRSPRSPTRLHRRLLLRRRTCARRPPRASGSGPGGPGAGGRTRGARGRPGSAPRSSSGAQIARAGDHPVGLVEPLRRLERLAVDLHRRDRVARAEVVGEREGQAQRAGRLSAVVAGAEQPDLGPHPLAGRRGDVAVRVALGIEGLVEEPEQLAERLGEVLDRERVGAPPQRGGGDLVGAGCAPDARGRSCPGGARRASRTARRRRAARGSAASRRPSRPGSSEVEAASSAASTAGAALAIPGMLWCSATQWR